MTDNRIEDMAAFARIADAGSLSAAAVELGLSLSVVSRRLVRLEERLGVRLMNRTTRQLSLTDEGAAFYARCQRILSDIEEAEAEVSRGRNVATGLLRITSTFAFARRELAPRLHRFQMRHPDLRIHLDASDRLVNLVDEGFDIAVRFGAMADSSLRTRALAMNSYVLCAAPDYLDQHGRPRAVAELKNHQCLHYGMPLNLWDLGDNIRTNGPLTTNDGDLAHTWALQGAGIVLKSIWDVYEDIHAGVLEIVLPELRHATPPISAVFPHNRLAAAKVRLVLDFLSEELRLRWQSNIAPLIG